MTGFHAFRRTASRWLSLGSVAFLAWAVIALIIAWSWAVLDGNWFPPNRPELAGNRGPWLHFYPGRSLVSCAMTTSLGAAALGVLGWLLRPSLRGAVLATIVIGSFLAMVLTHFWLID